MARQSINWYVTGGIFMLGLLIGLLVYQNLFPPKLVERIYTQDQNGTITSTVRPLSFMQVYTAQMPVLAVNSNDNTGVYSYVDVEIRSGKGRVLINTNPFVEPDTQFSAETAVTIAEKITGANLADKDVIMTFEANTSLVGGPSAGAAMTIAAISAIENKKVTPGVVMTGTIEDDGSIGQIGGVLEKAQAAAGSGAKLMLVPNGQSQLTYYERQVTQRQMGPFVINQVSYVPKKLDLVQYAKDNWKMEVKEVSNIQEAAKYFGLI